MNNKVLGIALVVIVLIATAGVFLPKAGVVNNIVEKAKLGALSGPTLYDHIEFRQNFTTGGTAVATTSTASTYTLTANELRNEVSYVSWTPSVNTTLTTMASTTAPFSTLKVGEFREIILYNASSTAASTITFAAGTGVDLQEDEGGTVIVNGLETARITYGKKSNSDVYFIVEPYQVGD